MQKDSVQKETHVVSVTSSHLETDAGGDEENNRPLLPLKRRHRLTGRYPPKVQVAEVKALLGREAENRAKTLLEESVRIRHVICGTCPCVTITSLTPDARMASKRDSHPRKSSPRERGKLGSKHTVTFSQGTWHQSRFLNSVYLLLVSVSRPFLVKYFM